MDEHVEVQVNYWKEVVEIRAEALKIEIDWSNKRQFN